MSGDHAKFFGEGMTITRMGAEGEIVTLETLKPDVMDRIKRIARMEERRLKYNGERNQTQLLRLATEYEKMHMSTMAGRCRKEARNYETTRASSKNAKARKGRHGKTGRAVRRTAGRSPLPRKQSAKSKVHHGGDRGGRRVLDAASS